MMIDDIKPENGNDFTLEEVQKHVGADIVQMVYIHDGMLMWLDEEGKFNCPNDVNQEATSILLMSGGLPYDYVAGDVFICEGDEVL